MASDTKALRIGGEGRPAEIDGAYFGGHIRPENLTAERIDRRLAARLSSPRASAAGARWRRYCAAETDAPAAIRQRIDKGTVVHADESPAWNTLHAGFAMQRINHQDRYRYHGAG